MRLSQVYGRFLVGCLLATAFGCGGANKPSPVNGTLTYEDGSPVMEATIHFVAKGGGRDASGYTGSDGSFDLTTFRQGDGALPGDYVVTVTKVTEETGTAKPTPEDSKAMMKAMVEQHAKHGSKAASAKKTDVPAVYSSAKTSPLKWTIDPGANQVTLKLKKNKA